MIFGIVSISQNLSMRLLDYLEPVIGLLNSLSSYPSISATSSVPCFLSYSSSLLILPSSWLSFSSSLSPPNSILSSSSSPSAYLGCYYNCFFKLSLFKEFCCKEALFAETSEFLFPSKEFLFNAGFSDISSSKV